MRGKTKKKGLQAALQLAEDELTAATKLSDVKAAAKKLMRAKEALKQLQNRPAKASTRPGPSHAAPDASAS